MRAAEERAHAALEAADRAAARRAAAARDDQAAEAHRIALRQAEADAAQQAAAQQAAAQQAATPQPTPTRQVPQVASSPAAPPKKRRHWLRLALITGVVVGALVAAAVIFAPGDEKKTATSEPPGTAGAAPPPATAAVPPADSTADPVPTTAAPATTIDPGDSGDPGVANDPADPGDLGDPADPEFNYQDLRFASGTSGTSVSGNVTSLRYDAYGLDAAAGQGMLINIVSSPSYEVAFHIEEPRSGNIVGPLYNTSTGYASFHELQVSGTHVVVVFAETAGSYDMDVQITNPWDSYSATEFAPFFPCENGEAIAAHQAKLNALGYPVDADGFYGFGTQAAVVQFQSDFGLPAVTGILDFPTIDMLDSR